ncbi:MAG TPA: HlyD family efflux transporter periplasmic adaptor subunit [Pirellulales bacterium]
MRRGFSLTGLAAVLGFLGAILAGGFWFLKPMLFSEQQDTTYMVDRVTSGVFTHDVVERGEIESSSNVEVRSQVQSRTSGAGGGTAIIEIVPEGTMVQEGEFIVKLDDSALRDELTQQQSVVNASDSLVIQSVANLETAKITKEEYEQGTFKQDEETLQSAAFVAEENLRRAQEYARHSERLAARGYVTQVQLEADKFAVKKAEADLALANTKLMVLRSFTKRKMVEQFEANIKIAEAKLKADEKTNTIDKAKLEFVQSQIDKCIINAPAVGQVVYANESGGRGGNDIVIQEGTVVRERQVIVRLPDPTKMQVKARINESRIDYVRAGLPVVIHLDALPGAELSGTVKRVSDYPLPTGWFGSNVKEYATFVEIHNPPDAMRPGMTAEVAIRTEQMENALQLPAQAVFERGGKHWCIVPEGSKLLAKEVKIGATNDKFVVLREGLAKDAMVLSNPRKYLKEVDLPATTDDDQKQMMAKMPPPKGDGEGDGSKRVAAAEGGPGGGGKKGRGGAGGGPAAMLARLMENDQNKDGKLEASELSEMPEQMRSGLMRADTNSDSFLDRAELTKAVQAFSAGGGGRPPGTGGGGGAAP